MLQFDFKFKDGPGEEDQPGDVVQRGMQARSCAFMYSKPLLRKIPPCKARRRTWAVCLPRTSCIRFISTFKNCALHAGALGLVNLVQLSKQHPEHEVDSGSNW